MRFLGIDYGSKRVGVAISDDGNRLAFPKTVLANDKSLLDALETLVHENNIGSLILGDSKDFNGKDNPIMKGISELKHELEERLGLPVILEPEFLTSVQAGRQGETSFLDASAAALILQSYLDKINSKAA